MDAIAAFAIAYLLGSIPFGLLLTRLGGAGDLRTIGSGSIGATNVLRTGRKGLAAATVLLDAGKASRTASSTVSPPTPESKIRIGASAGGCAATIGRSPSSSRLLGRAWTKREGVPLRKPARLR